MQVVKSINGFVGSEVVKQCMLAYTQSRVLLYLFLLNICLNGYQSLVNSCTSHHKLPKDQLPPCDFKYANSCKKSLCVYIQHATRRTKFNIRKRNFMCELFTDVTCIYDS